MDDIRERLLRRDYLYADADAYRAGVEAALAAMGTQAQPSQVRRTGPVAPHVGNDAVEVHEAMATAVGHA